MGIARKHVSGPRPILVGKFEYEARPRIARFGRVVETRFVESRDPCGFVGDHGELEYFGDPAGPAFRSPLRRDVSHRVRRVVPIRPGGNSVSCRTNSFSRSVQDVEPAQFVLAAIEFFTGRHRGRIPVPRERSAGADVAGFPEARSDLDIRLGALRRPRCGRRRSGQRRRSGDGSGRSL